MFQLQKKRTSELIHQLFVKFNKKTLSLGPGSFCSQREKIQIVLNPSLGWPIQLHVVQYIYRQISRIPSHKPNPHGLLLTFAPTFTKHKLRLHIIKQNTATIDFPANRRDICSCVYLLLSFHGALMVSERPNT